MIPIADPDIGPEARQRVQDVLDSGYLADGPEVRGFEDEFAAYCGTDHAVATANGTTALHAAFEALGIGDGDRVVTTPFSFVASANAVRLAGAEPVFADVDPDTYTLDAAAVEDAVHRHDGEVEAVMPVHLYGLPADMDPILDVADDHDLVVVEDAAQAHGAAYRGDRAGSLGDAACFSFYPTKNMTTGEGGMVTTDDDYVADRLRSYVNHGRPGTGGSYEHERVGHNYRMTSVAAAIGRAQLDRLPGFNEARREHAAALDDALADADVTAPTEPDDRRHVYHQYTVRAEDRGALAAHLDEHGVDTGVYYPTPIHEQPAYDGYDADAPAAERAADEVLSLPVHPGLADDDLQHIATTISNYEP
jgi:dTDP-4-amino-4,6-dideoxygalactose transaminase